jgi:hypothetical protein
VTTCERVRLTGTIEVTRPPGEAFALFTAEGERAWAESWDPEFPSPAADHSDPGTVFTTAHHGRAATWIVVGREPGAALAYASLIPGRRAGIVSVRLQPSSCGTSVTVSYDLTALVPEANAELQEFAAQYPQFLAHWKRAIAHAIGSTPSPSL